MGECDNLLRWATSVVRVGDILDIEQSTHSDGLADGVSECLCHRLDSGSGSSTRQQVKDVDCAWRNTRYHLWYRCHPDLHLVLPQVQEEQGEEGTADWLRGA